MKEEITFKWCGFHIVSLCLAKAKEIGDVTKTFYCSITISISGGIHPSIAFVVFVCLFCCRVPSHLAVSYGALCTYEYVGGRGRGKWKLLLFGFLGEIFPQFHGILHSSAVFVSHTSIQRNPLRVEMGPARKVVVVWGHRVHWGIHSSHWLVSWLWVLHCSQ